MVELGSDVYKCIYFTEQNNVEADNLWEVEWNQWVESLNEQELGDENEV